VNSCVVSGLIGEAEDRQISGYRMNLIKKRERVMPEDSNSWVPELTQSTS
jgi:hypothetical protein